MSVHGLLALGAAALAGLAGVSPVPLALALLLHLAKILAEARSWHAIVGSAYPRTPPRFRTSLGAFAGMIGANAILPGRFGEALRLGILRRRIPGSSVPTIASTIMLETAFELVLGVGVIVAVLLAGRSIGSVGVPGAYVVGLASHPVVLVLIGLAAAALAVLVYRRRARLGRLRSAMAQGLAVLSAPVDLLRGVLSWKVAAWAMRFAAVYCFLLAFHLDAGLWTVLLVVAAQNLAALLPLAPGSAGTQQAALVVALAGLAAPAAVLGFGIGMQLATTAVDLAAGAVAVALLAAGADLRAALRPRDAAPAPAG